MKKICLYIICITIFTCIGKPIKSNIGGRNLILAQESNESVNPYIIDGLIAMFDAEWNIGFENHDASTLTWKDLSGNNNDLFLDSADYAFEDKVITIYPNSIVNSSGKMVDTICIEVVMSLSKTTPFYVGRFIHTGYPNRGVGLRYKWLGYTIKNNDVIGSQVGTDSSLSLGSYSIGYDIFYKNGESLSRAGANASVEDMGELGITTGSALALKIRCIRMYSRQLTEDEVVHNYLIDKERFGL